MSELKTCFKKVDYDLSGLLHYIDIGDIGLPDIQRPFVWSNAKVRDLFDSMYRGFPVGYFLFWENATNGVGKQIGVGAKQHPVAHRLIVDGQQRLTSLFAVFRGRKVLRGKDMETGEFSAERRESQFAQLQNAQREVLDLRHWHQFLSCLIGAGFRSGEMLSSLNALLYAYAFYLIGRKRFGLPEYRLQRLIGRWFFAASLTGRYTTSPETIMDGDLNRLKGVKDAEGFVATLEGIMANELTNDFWTVTLPANLDSSSARNPELFAYMAAQNRLGAPVLFSHKKVADLLDPTIRATKRALERHHLFPRAWLERSGIDDLKQINQVANFALIEWPDNIDISDDSPREYVPQLRARFSSQDWTAMHEYHALPDGWEQMEYDVFLAARRKLMAAIIRRGFESLKEAGTAVDGAAAECLVALEALPSVAASRAMAAPLDEEGDDGETEAGELSPVRAQQLDYWSEFLAAVRRRGKLRESRQPQACSWMGFPLGSTRASLWAGLSRQERKVVAGVTFKTAEAKAIFRAMQAQNAAITAELGFALEWDEATGGLHSFAMVHLQTDPTERAQWPAQHAWLAEKLERLQEVFGARIAALPDGQLEGAQAAE
jgi:hypothetical protein